MNTSESVIILRTTTQAVFPPSFVLDIFRGLILSFWGVFRGHLLLGFPSTPSRLRPTSSSLTCFLGTRLHSTSWFSEAAASFFHNIIFLLCNRTIVWEYILGCVKVLVVGIASFVFTSLSMIFIDWKINLTKESIIFSWERKSYCDASKLSEDVRV